MASSFLLPNAPHKKGVLSQTYLQKHQFLRYSKSKVVFESMFLNVLNAPYPNFSFIRLHVYSLVSRLVNRMRVGHCLCQLFAFLTFGSHLRLLPHYNWSCLTQFCENYEVTSFTRIISTWVTIFFTRSTISEMVV